jgi:hypothetical protein
VENAVTAEGVSGSKNASGEENEIIILPLTEFNPFLTPMIREDALGRMVVF